MPARLALDRAGEPAEEGASGRLMAEQREDEIAMAIESRRLPHERQDAVGRGQREERVDVGVAHALRDEAQRQLRA